MQELSRVFTYIYDSLEKMNRRMSKIEDAVFGFSVVRHSRDYLGKRKFVFPNDFGFVPNQVIYFVDGKEFFATVDNGNIHGPPRS